MNSRRSSVIAAKLAGRVVEAALLGCTVLGCAGGEANLPPPPAPPAPPPTVVSGQTSSASGTDAGATAPAPAEQVEPAPVLVLGEASADPSPAPTVKIVAPSAGQVLAKDKASGFAIKLDVKNWPTATGSSHVHLILDNSPYKPIYDTKQPIKLSELPGGDNLAEGQHVLVAFPSRANHESVKTSGAFAAVSFYVGKKKADDVDLKKPMFVYSRPKGEYKGEAAHHVLVDFYLQNATLAEGKEQVKFTVTGPSIEGELTAVATKFGPPFYLDNLRTGTYSLKGELVGADGKVLPGPWNSTKREIKVDREAATPAGSGHDGHDAPKPASTTPSTK